MTKKQNVKIILLSALFLVSLGGFLLHLRIHQPTARTANYVPFISGILSVIIIPAMFMFRSTTAYAYVINGMLAIIGTITMAHYSLGGLFSISAAQDIFLKTTMPDIFVLWGKFALGKAIFDFETSASNLDMPHKGRFIRYPNMGWWLVHLVFLSLLYAIGNVFWK